MEIRVKSFTSSWDRDIIKNINTFLEKKSAENIIEVKWFEYDNMLRCIITYKIDA